MKKLNFSAALYNAADNNKLRPIMNYLYFNNGYIYATDAHILIKSPYKLHNVSNLDTINDKLLHKNVFKEVLKYDIVEILDGKLHCKNKEGSEVIFNFVEPSTVGTYPRCDSVIPELERTREAVDEIGLSPELLFRLSKCLVNFDGVMKLELDTTSKAMVMRTDNDEIALIMPYFV